MSSEPNQNQELLLTAKLEQDPSDWDTRQQLAHLLYDQGQYGMAAVVIWEADQIPSTDLDLAFAARILAKDQPRKAIRLLTAVLELNKGKAVQNMGMANALLHHGMVLQAARFYGAALEAAPDLVNPDLEHFILWTDEEQSLWGDFKDRRPKLGELPWMARDPMEALKLTSRVSLHTTPIAVPKLRPVLAEDLRNSLYQQEAKKDAKITPPPAVTIPADRVDPKHRRFDSTMGAAVDEDPQKRPAPAPENKSSDATQEVQIPRPPQKPGVNPDATQEVEIPKPAQKPVAAFEVTRPEPTKPPAAVAQTPKQTPSATPPPAPSATPPPAPKATPPPAPKAAIPAAIPAGLAAAAPIARVSPTIGPDGKLRRAKPADAASAPIRRTSTEPDMEAIEAAAKAEYAEKSRIASIAKAAAATDVDELPPSHTSQVSTQTSRVQTIAPHTSPTQTAVTPSTPGREPLPQLSSNTQSVHLEDGRELSEEEQLAFEADMKKTRAVARAAARESRLNAAASGVPIPTTDGRKGEWYYIYDNEAVGPILAEELKEKMNDPTIKPPLKMIWTGGMERWMPIYECPDLWAELDEANA